MRFLSRISSVPGGKRQKPALGFLCRDGRIIPQLSRYSIVSGLALSADFSVYIGLVEASIKASLAGVAGYGIGMALHYFLSSRFVFDIEGSRKSETRRFMEFVFSGLFGATLTGIVISVATQALAFDPIVAKAIAASLSFVSVFAIRRSFVFAAERDQQIADRPLSVYAKSGSSL
jgi:putative flippase GtrA